MKGVVAAAAVLGLMLSASAVEAKGCIKGAIVGGVAGHFAGHHGGVGALAGCAIGRHQANKQATQDNARRPNGQDGKI